MPLNLDSARKRLQAFDFQGLFTQELGWSGFSGRAREIQRDGETFTLSPIAELSGVVVFEVGAGGSRIPDARTRRWVQQQVARNHREHILVFVDGDRTASDWYWVKRENGKEYPRDHLYFKGQTGDLILSKLGGMVFDLTDFDQDGNVPIVEVTRRLSGALDIERVTKKFYGEFKDIHVRFVELIEGIDDERDRKWYASVILNRLMFVYFLQKKGFVDNNRAYLEDKFGESRKRGPDRFFSEFLQLLFFEGFAKRADRRSKKAAGLLGDVRYLNGGLFLKHSLERKYEGRIAIPDAAFELLFGLFARYSWHLDDRPSGQDDEINPDVLGYIFEKYINQKQFGAYYTRTEITEYLCDHTVNEVVLRKLNERLSRKYESIEEILLDADAAACRELLDKGGILRTLSLLDPACGSGAFLVAALKTLVNVYSALLGRIEFIKDRQLADWLRELQTHRSVAYEIKKRIITDNLFGVDIMEEAVEICKLRLFLTLVASVDRVSQLEPLPNVDFNVMAGNSLIGLLRVEEDALGLFTTPERYRDALREKNTLIDEFRHAASSATAEDMEHLKGEVDRRIAPLRAGLDEVLYHRFCDLGIHYQQALSEKKFQKRDLRIEDVQELKPFHWGFEFDEIMQDRGGFDAIITNPPWEKFKPYGKEFFQDYDNDITIRKMKPNEFEKVQARLTKSPLVKAAWLAYLSQFPHQSEYFRSAEQFQNQIGVVDGKKVGSDINYYKLFLEQCYNLLGSDGYCGIVIPSGVYTDLGATQLRELLFTQCRVTGLFGFENRRMIFEGVDSRFKFVVLTFEKGGKTTSFHAAYMRHDVAELADFPKKGAIEVKVGLARKLSPGSVSLMEFTCPLDIHIAEKMLRFPLLGERVEGAWNLKLTAEFHMTNDCHLFHSSAGPGRSPLYEGRMIHQFTHAWGEPRYWVETESSVAAFQSRACSGSQYDDFQNYRLVFRDVTGSTNERTLVATVVPPGYFTGNTLVVSSSPVDGPQITFITTVLNSFCVDWITRLKVATHCNMFYIYQLPVPRLTFSDARFGPIVRRAARLICTTPEYDDLAKEAGLGSHKKGATEAGERARLRAELDGLVAHLYGLTEEEFAHILGTFPIVGREVKEAALQAWRDVQAGSVK